MLIQAEGEKIHLDIKNSYFLENRMHGIITSPSSSVTLDSCRIAGNKITGSGIINANRVLLSKTIVYNNMFHNTDGIVGNATVKSCRFELNKMEWGYGLLHNNKADRESSLRVTNCTFMYNQGDLIYSIGKVDIVLDACNFTENNPHRGTLCIWNNNATLHLSGSTITAPTDGNKVAVYFGVTSKQIKMTDFLTYNSSLGMKNTTLNTSSTKTFLQESQAAGLIIIQRFKEFPYTVTQEETMFASCKYK